MYTIQILKYDLACTTWNITVQNSNMWLLST